MNYSSVPPQPPAEPPVAAPGPYPPVAAEGRNPRYAHILQQDMAASRGEMTAINQYLYQRWVLLPGGPELAGLLARIARVEMLHLNILGQLVVLLGGDPRCSGQNGSFPWNGNLLYYAKDPPALLRYNTTLEKNAAEAYRTQSRQIRDSRVSEMLARLAEDEELHHSIFQERLRELLPGK